MNVKRADRSKVKDTIIRLRVTKAEAEKFHKKAKQYNCDTLSEYIRIKCLSQPSRLKTNALEVGACKSSD